METVDKYVESVRNHEKVQFAGLNGEQCADGKFYVNGTCLCADTEEVTYVALTHVNNKCREYLKELLNKLTFKKVVKVPQWLAVDNRHHEFEAESIEKAFKTYMDSISDDRYGLGHLRVLLDELVASNSSLVNECRERIEKLDVPTEAMKYISEHSYYEIVRKAYFEFPKDIEFVSELRQWLNPTGEYAFLWLNTEDNMWYSSETWCGAHKITITLEEGWKIASAYHNGTARHGDYVGQYRALRVTDGFIKIGCNKYSKKMFESCYYYMKDELGLVDK